MRAIPHVKSVMTPFPYYVAASAPMAEAREFMQKERIRHLPVVDDGRLVGVVTDRDIKLVLGPDFAYPGECSMTVADVMVSEPYVVDLEARLDDVLAYMAEHHIGSALVTRRGKLAGLLTTTDACRLYAEHLRAEHAPPSGNDAA